MCHINKKKIDLYLCGSAYKGILDLEGVSNYQKTIEKIDKFKESYTKRKTVFNRLIFMWFKICFS